MHGSGVPGLATREYLHLWLSISSSHEAADGETGTGDGRTQEASLALGSSATPRPCREYLSHWYTLQYLIYPLTLSPPRCVQPSRRADSSGSAPVPDPPTKAALPWLHHDSPEPQPEQETSYGTRSGRTTRSTPVRRSPPSSCSSLEIASWLRSTAPPRKQKLAELTTYHLSIVPLLALCLYP